MGDGLVPQINADLLLIELLRTSLSYIRLIWKYAFVCLLPSHYTLFSTSKFNQFINLPLAVEAVVILIPIFSSQSVMINVSTWYPFHFSIKENIAKNIPVLYMHGIYNILVRNCRKRRMRYEMKCKDFPISQTLSVNYVLAGDTQLLYVKAATQSVTHVLSTDILPVHVLWCRNRICGRVEWSPAWILAGATTHCH